MRAATETAKLMIILINKGQTVNWDRKCDILQQSGRYRSYIITIFMEACLSNRDWFLFRRILFRHIFRQKSVIICEQPAIICENLLTAAIICESDTFFLI